MGHCDHDCKHENVKYCKECGKVYCKECGREWPDKDIVYIHTPVQYPWQEPYTYPGTAYKWETINIGNDKLWAYTQGESPN